jgi:LmbE family N-acetylglucosaminyl deacetylase
MQFNLFKSLRSYLAVVLALFLLTAHGTQPQHAQTSELGPVDRDNRAQLHQALLDLTNSFTVLCVAAHPDDEDGSTLTVLRRKYGVHTVSLFSTYGEGGQNAVGPELYEELGVIRARETMAAAEVQGSEPHFLGLRDFGFSKSAEETFRAWGQKEALRRMVFQIRRLRPDAIITNHDTKSGHGHHQATGRLILQAFAAAADPKQFPEQLNQVSVWQAQRLFVRAPRGDSGATQLATPEAPPKQFTIDPNDTDPIRGTTYAQQALLGLQKHATQGPWPKTVSPNGARIIRYSLVLQVPTAAGLPNNATSPIDGLHLPEAISKGFVAPTIDNKPLTEFIDKREEVLVSLINARKRGAFTAAKEVVDVDPQRFSLMASRLDKALAVAAGVGLTADTDEPVLVPGEKARVSASLSNNGDSEVQIKRLEVHVFGSDNQLNTADKMLPETETSAQFEVTTPKSTPLSVPSADHLYDSRLFGQPVALNAELSVDGAPFSLATEIERDVTPEVQIVSVDPAVYVSTPATSQKPLEFKVRLINRMPTEFRGLVRIVGPSLETGREVVLAPHSSDVVNVSVRAPLPVTRRRQAKSEVAVTVDLPIPKTPIHKRNVTLVYADALVAPDLVVGYLPSFDQSLSRSLDALGVEAKQLAVSDIASGDLSKFDTIILDNRSYEAHRELIPVNDRLLKFVEEGGTLLVLYHKTNEWNPDERQKRPQLAPYPILLDDDRVTEEDAPIDLLQPRHPLLNSPNRITRADFANWIQERGLYFPKEWDSHYAALLATNDKGEPPLRGGLLVASYGKGNYIYTSMVWYRQLRAGIPGGYRFFANLISYGKVKSEAGRQTVSSTP